MTMPSTPEVQAGMLDLISAWDGIGVVVRYDRPSGTWIFIAVHDDTLGRPAGGCRMKMYDRPEDGLLDALRLSEGMTYKWAAIELGFGGGKSVLAIPRPMEGAERTGLLQRFAELLNTLHDSYGVGPDMGTTPDDMQVIARVSDNVVGVMPGGAGPPKDPGPFTALGVFAGIRAALRHRYDSDDLSDRSVHVQGVGDVGYPLARMIHDAGGRVLVSDLDGERGASVAAEVGGEVIEADQAHGVECDVYAPCAVGATLNARTIAQLACGIVAGSANNQLETDDDAQRLLHRGILYAPDYIINAGGAMAFGLISQGITDTAELQARVGGIGQTLDAIFAEAASEGVTPPESARRKVERILASARAANLTYLGGT